MKSHFLFVLFCQCGFTELFKTKKWTKEMFTELEENGRANQDVYTTFVLGILPAATSKRLWNRTAATILLADFVTPSTEAFALLCVKITKLVRIILWKMKTIQN